MDINTVLSKLNTIENSSNESFNQVDQNYTDANVVQQPSEISDPSPNMNVNLNAQGLDNIESIMSLFGKINTDSTMQQRVDTTSADDINNTLSKMSDFNTNADTDIDQHFDSELDSGDEYSFSTDSSQKLLPKENSNKYNDYKDDDDDLVHNLFPEDQKIFDNEVDELEGDIDDIIARGDDLHKSKKTFPKTASGDNPRHKISYNEDFYNQVKRDLQKKLNEVKSRSQKSKKMQTRRGR